MDETDRKILECLQSNARCTNADIARCVDMAPSAVLERIRKLERRGILKGYEARIDPETVGLGLLAFLFVKAEGGPAELGMGQRLAELEDVLEVHHIAGEDCFILKVRASSPKGLRRFLTEKLANVGAIQSTRSTIVLDTVKESFQLPLDGAREP